MRDDAVPILDLLGGTLPGARGPFAHLPLDVLCRLIGRPAGLKRHPAAASVRSEADGIGVPDRRVDILDRDPQHFGQLLRHRGTGAADIGRAFDQLDPTVRVDNRQCTGGTRAIAPEPTGHTTTAVQAGEGCGVMGVILGRLQRLHKTDTLEDRTSRPAGAFFGAVEQAELERVHAQLVAQLVNGRFHHKGRRRSAGGAVGCRLGAVHHDIVPLDPGIGDVVSPHDAVTGRRHWRTRKGAGLVDQVGFRCHQFAGCRGAEFHPNMGSRGRPRRFKHFGP